MVFASGDVIGFTASTWLGRLINLATLGSPWAGLTHVGVVVASPSGELVLFESTTLCDMPCLFQRRRVDGVQAHWLRQRIVAYPGKVWHYLIAKAPDGFERYTLYDWCRSRIGTPYDVTGALHARGLCCGWLIHRLLPENLQSMFCSEFVPAALREIGRFDTLNASAWSPNALCRELVRRGTHLPARRIK